MHINAARIAKRGLFVVMMGIVLSACAASAPKVPVAVATAPPAIAPSVAATPTSATYEWAELDRRARLMGYRVEMRNHERLYCQRGAAVGSHIANSHCMSAELMAQAARDDEEMKNKLSLRNNALCPSCVQKNN